MAHNGSGGALMSGAVEEKWAALWCCVLAKQREAWHWHGSDANCRGIASMSIEQTSDGTAEMGAAMPRCAKTRRAMEQLRTAQICNGKASSHCAQICKGEAPICSGTAAISSGKAVLCDGKARQSEKLQRKRTASTGGGGAKKGIGYDLRGLAMTCEDMLRNCWGMTCTA